MIDNTTSEKKEVPPYLTINKLREVFQLLSTRSFNQLTAKEFVGRGISSSDSFLVMATLRFLKVIDESGYKTENLTKLQLMGEARQTALREIVLDAYKKLFETAPEANKLPHDELFNEFVAIYQTTARIARSAVPAFIWLCSEAGLEVAETPQVKERKPRLKALNNGPKLSEKFSAKKDVAAIEEGKQSIDIGIFKLILPKSSEVTQGLVNGDFKIAYDELQKLSEKFNPINVSEVEKG